MSERFISKVDFHVHVSDESAWDVLNDARRKNIKCIALVGKLEFSDSILDFISYGKEIGVDVFAGVESHIRGNNGETFDMISLGFDPTHPSVSEIWKHTNREGINREAATEQQSFLESVGFSFENLPEEDRQLLDDIMAGGISAPGISFCRILSRSQENAKKILELKVQEFEEWQNTIQIFSTKPPYTDPVELDAKFLYRSLFAVGKPGYSGGARTSAEIINRVHQAKGAVLYSPEGMFDTNLWNNLKEEGIDGIMGWHAYPLGCDEKDGNQFQAIPLDIIRQIKKDQLLVLGGSDYTYWKNDFQLGVGAGNMFISERRYEEFKNYLKTRNNL